MSNKGKIHIVKEIVSYFNKSGEKIGSEEVESMTIDPPKTPSFPINILSLAVLKDVLDGGTFTGIGYALAVIGSFIIAIVLFVWLLGKGKRWQKWLLKKAMMWIGVVIVSEHLPGFNILPLYTVFVLLAYYREKKVVKLFWKSLELLEKTHAMDIEILPKKSKRAKAIRRTSRSPKQRRRVVRRARRIQRIRRSKEAYPSMDGITRKPAWQT